MKGKAAFDILIIGGGAAGLFAGAFIKSFAPDILFAIAEKTSPGTKLLMTGGGRCNISNKKSPRELKDGFYEAGSFIYKAIDRFSPADACRYISEELKVRLKEEENNKIFPASDKASDILGSLISKTGRSNILENTEITDIKRSKDLFELRTRDGRNLKAFNILIATGGMSFPATGSDGFIYGFCEKEGLRSVPPLPGVAALILEGEERKTAAALAGVTLDPVRSQLYIEGKKAAEAEGSLLFTHKGLSGPAVMALSRFIRKDALKDTHIELDLIPDITEEEFNKAFENPQTKTVNALPASLPRALREGILKLADIPEDSYVKDLRKGQRREIYKRCRAMRFKISLLPPVATATVTRGGISLKEIDRETMGIIKIPGAYVAGEALDVDGRSGGYNLQLAMSTAYSAVQDMIKSKRNREKEGG